MAAKNFNFVVEIEVEVEVEIEHETLVVREMIVRTRSPICVQ